jgi:hypothetical protein
MMVTTVFSPALPQEHYSPVETHRPRQTVVCAGAAPSVSITVAIWRHPS